MLWTMNMAILMLALLSAVPVLTHCGSPGTSLASNPGNNPVGTGPFDKRGNYIEDWADNPAKWYRPSPTPSPVRPPQAIAKADREVPALAANMTLPAAASPLVSNPRPQTSAAAPRPKPVVVKAKPKPKPVAKKPAPKRYTVRSGDNLSKIAARHKSSVTAIQRANGISGSLIRPGQVLTIPRY